MKNRRFIVMLRTFIGFMGILLLLFVQSIGIQYEKSQSSVSILDKDIAVNNKPLSENIECLLIFDSDSDTSLLVENLFKDIFLDMRIPYEEYDIALNNMPELDNYQTVVITATNIEIMQSDILQIIDWVDEGGNAMFALPLQLSTTFSVLCRKFGILEPPTRYISVDDFVSEDDFMLGSQKTYGIMEGYESSLDIELIDGAKVYASTSNGDPLIWTYELGKGKFVISNFAYVDKCYRGVFASAYSLMNDVCAYPVINASTFYLDDFPSPVPSGDGQYIQRDYGMSIAEFYSGKWWPDLLQIANKYNIPFTGLIIETYDDKTSGKLESNKSTGDYYYYGNMLLNKGGELGLHGYNHQPLCLDSFEYADDLGYKTWESIDEMYFSLEELIDFSRNLFPDETFSVYVPPSNILSDEGRTLIGNSFPEIRCVASIYFYGENEYYQEFGIADDGIVETPRIISSCELDDYMRFAAFSEMNLHYVNSHFMHPDDLLDVDRGAELGWEELKRRLTDYLDWLDYTAPNIRHLSGSGMAGAVQRYSNICIDREISDDEIKIEIEGLIDESYLLIRINEGDIDTEDVTGGELIKLNDSLYQLKATNETVVIKRK